MGFFNKIKNVFTEDTNTIKLSDINAYFESHNINVENDLSEVTYYTCLKVLSESLGKLSIHLKDGDGIKVENHDALKLLKVRPNSFMSPSSLKTLLEYNRNHYGNSYAYIKYDKLGRAEGIYPLEPDRVRIIIDNTNTFNFDTPYVYEYQSSVDNKTYLFKNTEILHFKGGLSENGIVGTSVRETLARTLSASKEAQACLDNLYKNGLTANAIIKYTGDFDTARKTKLVKELSDFASNSSGERIIPIPFGMDLQPIDLKLTDAQFYELRKYTALQIASAFGIKPNHLNDYEKSSYSNSEMQNLSFYVDTLLYILTHYEEELNYKMLDEEERAKGYHFEINVATILRGDLKTQAQSLSRLTQSSIYRINEARQYLGMPKIKGGDTVMVNGSYVELENIGKAYERYEKDNEKDNEEVEENDEETGTTEENTI